MKKSLTFFGLGLLIVSFIGFLLRLVDVPVFQGKLLWLIVFGLLGLVLVIVSFIGRKKSALLWFGLGSLAYAVAVFGLRSVGLNDSLSLFIIALVFGLVFLIWGLVKRG